MHGLPEETDTEEFDILWRVITSLKMDYTSTRKNIIDMEMGHPDTVTRCRRNKRYTTLWPSE